ncbi:MAG: hypothetical protein GY730_04160 [bacterium]|nr:hypothetical protein [bacterium]
MNSLENITVSTQELSSILTLTERRISMLTKEGVLSKKAKGKYELKKSVGDYIKYLKNRMPGNASMTKNIDYNIEKARKTKAEADIAEMEAAKMAAELVPAEDIKFEWANLVTEVCIRIRNIPTRVVSLIVGELEERRIKEILLNEIDLALTSIANGNNSNECNKTKISRKNKK